MSDRAGERELYRLRTRGRGGQRWAALDINPEVTGAQIGAFHGKDGHRKSDAFGKDAVEKTRGLTGPFYLGLDSKPSGPLRSHAESIWRKRGHGKGHTSEHVCSQLPGHGRTAQPPTC